MKARMIVMARNTRSGRQSCGRAAVIMSQMGMVGSDCSSSITRWMTMSIQPPKYPEIPPRKTPRIVLSATATRPTVIEVRVPNIMRDHWSRPRRSVPRKWGRPLDFGSLASIRWMSVSNRPSTLYLYPRTKSAIGIRSRLIAHPLHFQRDRIALADDVRHRRIESRLVEEGNPLHGDEGEGGIGRFRVLVAEEVRHQDDGVEDEQDDRAGDRQAVLAESPPDQLPVRRDGDALFVLGGELR